MSWHEVTEKPPFSDFVWCRVANGEIILAYATGYEDGPFFQEANTVGDSEGLSVEYHYDVTHWCELVEPPFPGVA